MDIQFYHRMIKVYEEREASEQTYKELYETMFLELCRISPDDLVPDHSSLFKLAENFFASIDDFDKASAIKNMHEAAENIFKARERIEQLKIMLANKNKN